MNTESNAFTVRLPIISLEPVLEVLRGAVILAYLTIKGKLNGRT